MHRGLAEAGHSDFWQQRLTCLIIIVPSQRMCTAKHVYVPVLSASLLMRPVDIISSRQVQSPHVI